MSAEALAQVLRPLQNVFNPGAYPDLLVGLGEPDDAAVWKIDDQKAVVVTTDFFTPVVDDAYDYGSIAAANSLSDIYAMGAQPFLALNIAAMPPDLPSDIIASIFLGGAEKVREAGAVLAGGHTIQDTEPKYGLIAVGFVHPDQLISKGGASIGDILVMTKPISFGTITTALKQQKADLDDVAEAVGWMKRLNNTARDLAVEFNVRGGTDITGFSLLGHGVEMAEASGVRLRFSFRKIPILEATWKYANQWIFPGGTSDNRLFFEKHVVFFPGMAELNQMLLFDAQTSGGLLLSVPPHNLEKFKEKADKLNQPIWVVGEVLDGSGVEVVP